MIMKLFLFLFSLSAFAQFGSDREINFDRWQGNFLSSTTTNPGAGQFKIYGNSSDNLFYWIDATGTEYFFAGNRSDAEFTGQVNVDSLVATSSITGSTLSVSTATISGIDTFSFVATDGSGNLVATSTPSGGSGTSTTSWASYTPASSQGLGSITTTLRYRQVGDDTIEIKGIVVLGTTTASEARIALPSSYTTTASMPSLELAGNVIQTVNSASSYYVLIEPSVTYMTFGIQNTSDGAYAKKNGSSIFASAATISINASFNVQ